MAQEIVHPAAARFGHGQEIKTDGGDDEVLVDLGVELENLAVFHFPRVVGGQGLRAGGGGTGRQELTNRQSAQCQSHAATHSGQT
jgi:hypothetical protein